MRKIEYRIHRDKDVRSDQPTTLYFFLSFKMMSAEDLSFLLHHVDNLNAKTQIDTFRIACNGYAQRLIDVSMEHIKRSKKASESAPPGSVLLDTTHLMDDIGEFKYDEMYFGIKPRLSRMHDPTVFITWDIERPFARARAELARRGYKLQHHLHISGLVLELSWA